jgi:hypothetical protein
MWSEYVSYWGPSILAGVVVIVMARMILARYRSIFKTQAENMAAQTAAITQLNEALSRIAAALEKKPGLD